ncbi:MAG: response regulator transcription factor [Acidimicrobiales bacterium]
MSSPIRLVLLNDYELVIAGLRRMLEPFSARVRVVETVVGGEAVDGPADIALFDTFGRTDTGVDRLRALVADDRIGHVVVFSTSMPTTVIDQLMDMGVSGCLSKSLSAVDLVRSLERIHGGEVVVATRSGTGSPNLTPRNSKLSYREAEVLALLSQGLRNRAIANALYVGEETVKSHLKSIYRKLGVSSRGEAIAAALRDPGFGAPQDHGGAAPD